MYERRDLRKEITESIEVSRERVSVSEEEVRESNRLSTLLSKHQATVSCSKGKREGTYLKMGESSCEVIDPFFRLDSQDPNNSLNPLNVL